MRINAFFACGNVESQGNGISNIIQAGIQSITPVEFRSDVKVPIKFYCILVPEPNDKPGKQVARLMLIGEDGPASNPMDTEFTLGVNAGFSLTLTGHVPIDAPRTYNFSMSVLGSDLSASWPLTINSPTA